MSRPLRVAVALAIAVVLGTALVGWLLRAALRDGEGRARPEPGTTLAVALAGAVAAGPPFEGLTEARVAVDDEDRCLRVVIADELDERVQGLRAVRTLGPYDGMLFVFGADATSRFTSAGTLVALDIGWYDAAGNPVDRARMSPCPDRSDCPTVAATGPYRYALETEAGGLGTGALGGCGAR